MPHPAPRIAPRIARLLVLAVPLFAAACSIPTRRGASWEGGLGEGGADGFNTVELHEPHEVACIGSELWPDDMRLPAEGGADGFTETGYAPNRPHCLAGAVSGWRAAGGWGVLGGWTPFSAPPGDEGGRPREFSGLWGDTPASGPSGPGLTPFIGFWPAANPAIRVPTGSDPHDPPDDDPPEDDRPRHEDTLLVVTPDPRPAVPRAITEPATLLLLGSALVVLGLLRREREAEEP